MRRNTLTLLTPYKMRLIALQSPHAGGYVDGTICA